MDPILYWNEVANEANRTTHTSGAVSEVDSQGPCGSSRASAIVHLAMHDAYFNGRSRVCLGVHWVFDAFAVTQKGQMDLTQNVGGVRLGLDIADDIAANGLKASAAAGPRIT